MKFHDLKEAAEMAGMLPARLLELVRSGAVRPTIEVSGDISACGFSDEGIVALSKLAEPEERKTPKPSKVFRPDVEGGPYKVKDLSEAWGLSEDTLRRIFVKEPEVLKVGDKNPKKHKRSYQSLRIPHAVAMRVYRRLGI